MFLQDKKFNSSPVILIVEDDKSSIQVLGNILSRQKYEIAVAFDGPSALDLLDKYTPDLILMDVLMPEMDGYELCTRIKSMERFRYLPILFLTAKAETEDVIMGFDTGGVDYITKPFKTGELLARIRTHLQLKKSREELYEQTIHDELTSLFNRRYMRMALENELCRSVRYELSYSVAMLDLDNFKSINDQFGHNVGDLALKRFAQICQDCIRKTDTLGRIGGEEFCLLLPETDVKEASIVMERIRKSVEEETEDSSLGIPPFTVSIGLTGNNLTHHTECDVDTFLEAADDALYQAKYNGKNRVIFLSQS